MICVYTYRYQTSRYALLTVLDISNEVLLDDIEEESVERVTLFDELPVSYFSVNFKGPFKKAVQRIKAYSVLDHSITPNQLDLIDISADIIVMFPEGTTNYPTSISEKVFGKPYYFLPI